MYDIARIRHDMNAEGVIATDVARRARLSDKTISLFLTGKRQSPRTAAKIAEALRQPLTRYYIRTKGGRDGMGAARA